MRAAWLSTASLSQAGVACTRAMGPDSLGRGRTAALGRSRVSGRCITDRLRQLLSPCLSRQNAQIVKAYRRGLAPAGQTHQNLTREITMKLTTGRCQRNFSKGDPGPRLAIATTQRALFAYFKISPEITHLAVMLFIRLRLSLRNPKTCCMSVRSRSAMRRFATVGTGLAPCLLRNSDDVSGWIECAAANSGAGSSMKCL